MRFTCRPVDTSFFDTAPMRFENVVELDAPPATVFAIFDDEQTAYCSAFRSSRRTLVSSASIFSQKSELRCTTPCTKC
jgi:hypothetical protein